MSRRPSRHCPRASGIVPRSQRRAGSGDSWPQCIVETWRSCLSNSTKSPPPLRTCRKACLVIADSGRERRYAMTCPWRHNYHLFHRKVRLKQTHKIDLEATTPKEGKGFQVVPWRWAVERTFAWLLNDRRHSRDYERLTTNSAAMIQISMIRLLLNRLA